MIYMLLYVPVCLAALFVYETCRHEDLPTIAIRAVKDFAVLTGVFFSIAAVLYVINRFF